MVKNGLTKSTCVSYLIQPLRISKVLFAILALLHTSISHSSDASQKPDVFSLSLEDLMQVKVSSSTLTYKKLKSAPASISVFTRQQINQLGTHFLHELINFAPGFQSFRQGENGVQYYHSARGHRNSVSAREILILVDGVRLNREYDNNYSVPMFSLHNVEKVEFIRGPGSALYGSNAFLGVIDIKTIKTGNELQVIAGEHDRTQLNSIINQNINNWDLTLAANIFDEGGQSLELQEYADLSAINSKDPRSGEDISLALRRGNTAFSGAYYNREAEDFYRSERVSDPHNAARHSSYHLRFGHFFNFYEELDTNIDLIYSHNAYDSGGYIPSLGVIAADQSEKNVDLKIHNHWVYSKDQSLEFGLDLRHSQINAFEFFTENNGRLEFYPSEERNRAGIYIQNQSRLKSDTEIILGGRYDKYPSIGSSFSPRLGLVHPVSKRQSLKVLYGKAFRVPTENELSLKTFSGALAGNPQLKPETIQTLEFIWMGQWKKNSLSINTFYNVIDSIIVRDDSAAASEFYNQKSDEAFYGMEIELITQLSERWMLNANYSTVKNQAASDFRQADQLGSLILNYNHKQWNFNASATYSGERQFVFGDNLKTIDAYWVANSLLRYHFDAQKSLYLGVKNLFDQEYGTPTQRTAHSEPIPNRGRETYVGFKKVFN